MSALNTLSASPAHPQPLHRHSSVSPIKTILGRWVLLEISSLGICDYQHDHTSGTFTGLLYNPFFSTLVQAG